MKPLPHAIFPLRMEYWKKHNYISLNLTLEEDEEEEEEEEEELDTSDRELHYLSGDVTRPQNTGDTDAIVIHCVGMSRSSVCCCSACDLCAQHVRTITTHTMPYVTDYVHK